VQLQQRQQCRIFQVNCHTCDVGVTQPPVSLQQQQQNGRQQINIIIKALKITSKLHIHPVSLIHPVSCSNSCSCCAPHPPRMTPELQHMCWLNHNQHHPPPLAHMRLYPNTATRKHVHNDCKHVTTPSKQWLL